LIRVKLKQRHETCSPTFRFCIRPYVESNSSQLIRPLGAHPRICGQPLTKKLKEGLKDFKSEARKSRQTKISGPALSAVTRDFLWRRMWDLNSRGAGTAHAFHACDIGR